MSSVGSNGVIGGGGRTIPLATGLALLSYVPFEYVAKGTLLLCALLFIVDPFPPLSRFIALLSLILVAILSRFYNEYVLTEQQEQNDENNGIHIVTNCKDEKKDL